MAATIIEQEAIDETDVADLPQDTEEQSPSEILESFEAPEAEQAENVLPEKYQGKSMEDLARMHQEAEKLIGKHSSEVGELRKVVDTYITSQISASNQTAQPEPEPVDFFEDPEQAVNRAIETHPVVQQAKQTAQQQAKQTALGALQQKHPDIEQVLTDPKFAEWVQASPVRQELFQRADKQYDAAVADELLTLYKERASLAQQSVAVETQARKQQVKAASTGAQGAGAGGGGKRIYRRADIIKLMKNDPDRYEAISNEIMQAYQEGRVR